MPSVSGWAAILWGLSLAACSSPSRLPAVPDALRDQAEVVGLPGVRLLGDPSIFIKDAVEGAERERAMLAASGYKGPLPPAAFLALSGGGDNGAFGAGLLVGWTAAGTRPEFKLVSGISTGALIAPFAFLGPKYDAQLRAIYTGISDKDIMTKRSPLAVLFDDAMADNTPLWRLTRQYVTAEMLRDIAIEYRKGRFLLIGTTNLDEMEPDIWNVGKIAASGNPHALELIQSLLVASAAIPGAFPPVLIDVEAGGRRYQEMHVDGGTAAQVFVYPTTYHLYELGKIHGFHRERAVYIIRNARLDPGWSNVERRTLSIIDRAVTSLIQTQGRGDLYRIFALSQRDHVDFNLAYIPATFSVPHPKDDFDNGYMRQLFQFGYDLAASGHEWAKSPPGY